MAIHRHPFSDFRSFSRLFSTYAGEFDPLASFFAGDFRDPRQRGQIALRVVDQFTFRETLISILSEQNEAFGTGKDTHENIQKLAREDAVAVVTGQQLGLFTGPLYTLLKTVTAIQLAKRIEADTGRPVVPVFWLEGEDHDFDEVASATIPVGSDLSHIRYTGPVEGPVPVGRVVLDASIEETIRELEEALPPTEFRNELLSVVRAAYHPGRSFLDAFAHLMCHFFAGQGLVFISGDDIRLKSHAAPLFRKEVRDHARTSLLLDTTSQKLEDGYHVQVQSRTANLFILTDSGRRSIDPDGESFVVRDTDERYDADALYRLIDDHPERMSPNVVMRPLYQDTILPTAAYVAGPGEVSYYAQFRPLYEWAGVPMPIIYPRASVSLVEGRIGKLIDRFELPLPAFERTVDELFHEIVLDRMTIDPDEIFSESGAFLDRAVDTTMPAIEQIDASLVKSGEATRVALWKEWNRLRDRVIKSEKRRQERTRIQIERVKHSLFPGSNLQERTISPLYFLNKYGPDFISILLNTVELDTEMHQVVEL